MSIIQPLKALAFGVRLLRNQAELAVIICIKDTRKPLKFKLSVTQSWKTCSGPY